jgi:hypothetical protein
VPKEIGDILLTIRMVESGNRYDLPPNRGKASGAYQYIESSWNNYRGYPAAYLAPSWIQDERALLDVQAILDTWKGDASMVPVIWYYPRSAREPALLDQVPLPWLGNRLTVREYQRRWLDVLGFITGDPVRYRLAGLAPEVRFLAGLPPELALSLTDLREIAFPVLGRAVVSPPVPCVDEACEPGTQAIVYGQKLQPVLAVATGVVTHVDLGDPISGAVTVTVTDALGRTYHYAGFNDDSPSSVDGAADPSLRVTALARTGSIVRAGQILGYMGDTDPMPSEEHRGTGDEPVWPHVRLTIRDPQGVRLDADRLVTEAQQRQACHVGIGPWSVPEDPQLGDARGTVRVSAILNGGFVLHDDGTVTAFGRSALILPPEDCVWAPVEAFGPGASGSKPGDGWDDPITLPPQFWVSGLLAGDGVLPAGLLRRG